MRLNRKPMVKSPSSPRALLRAKTKSTNVPPALPERGKKKKEQVFDFQLVQQLVEIGVTLQGMYKRKLLLKVSVGWGDGLIGRR